jgi:mannose-6-phosphate isomerase
MTLYPLRFDPIFTQNIWGGDRLPRFLRRPPPPFQPVGEAWVLSDEDGKLSTISNGPLAGTTLRDLLANRPERILGSAKLINGRFPLLLKFLDAQQELSVQVHPNDERAAKSKPGANGKTEAWVILDANPAKSLLYSGFKSGMTAEKFRTALKEKTTPETLHSFSPKPGDCVFLPAGIVHAIGAETFLFEVQQTSDITYRLYDWDRVDAKTKLPRELHVEQGLAASDFTAGPCDPVRTKPAGEGREELVSCEYFTLHRRTSDKRFTVGAKGECRLVVVVDGSGAIESDAIRTGDVLLIPAEVGECSVLPSGRVTVLECGLTK